MPTVLTHALVGGAMGRLAGPRKLPWRFRPAAIVCAMLPDADVIGFRLGIEYGDILGHRGLTHSLLFAVLTGLIAGGWVAPHAKRGSKSWWGWWALFTLITASHGLLDAMTDGGLGVAFFSPLSNHRYFFPFRPIHVAPISISRIFTTRGARVLGSEIIWIWLPTLVALLLARYLRRSPRRDH